MNVKQTSDDIWCDDDDQYWVEQYVRGLTSYSLQYLKNHLIDLKIVDPFEMRPTKEDINEIVDALNKLIEDKPKYFEDNYEAEVITISLPYLWDNLLDNNLSWQYVGYMMKIAEFAFEKPTSAFDKVDSKRMSALASRSKAHYEKPKKYCIRVAAFIWSKLDKDDPNYRIGSVCKCLRKRLKEKKDLKVVELETIYRWLKLAEKEGKLIIPKEASSPGANKTL